MKARRITRATLPRLLTLLGLSMTLSCVDIVEDSPSDAVKIGALLPFSGELAASGINLERPLMMAADTINAAGGIQGTPVVIVAADSNVVFEDVEDYETNKAVVAEWVAQNDLKAVIGPLIPELGQRLAPELRRSEAVHISGSIAPSIHARCKRALLVQLPPHHFNNSRSVGREDGRGWSKHRGYDLPHRRLRYQNERWDLLRLFNRWRRNHRHQSYDSR